MGVKITRVPEGNTGSDRNDRAVIIYLQIVNNTPSSRIREILSGNAKVVNADQANKPEFDQPRLTLLNTLADCIIPQHQA